MEEVKKTNDKKIRKRAKKNMQQYANEGELNDNVEEAASEPSHVHSSDEECFDPETIE